MEVTERAVDLSRFKIIMYYQLLPFWYPLLCDIHVMMQ